MFTVELIHFELGSAGPGYNQYMLMEMAFAIEAFADFTSKPRNERETLLADPQAFSKWLDRIPSGFSCQLPGSGTSP